MHFKQISFHSIIRLRNYSIRLLNSDLDSLKLEEPTKIAGYT